MFVASELKSLTTNVTKEYNEAAQGRRTRSVAEHSGFLVLRSCEFHGCGAGRHSRRIREGQRRGCVSGGQTATVLRLPRLNS